MGLRSTYNEISGGARNCLRCIGKKKCSMVFFVTEPTDWVIKWDGVYLTENLKKTCLSDAALTMTEKGISNQIVYFGSMNSFLKPGGHRDPGHSNRAVLTWYHVVPGDPRNRQIVDALDSIDFVHTTCEITRKSLLDIGVPEDKIVVIPTGVDLDTFKPVSLEEKSRLRKELGIPEDKIVIGSFQKDGDGWGEGMEPKLIKGPDTLVDVLGRQDREKIFVLLLGPSRGYVKRELQNRGIQFKHVYLKNFLDISKYYNVLDMYLITSRLEGGPKGLVEAMASGIPVVTTKAGMAPDIVVDGTSGLTADVGDVMALSEKVSGLIDNGDLARKVSESGLIAVKDLSWDRIAARHRDEILARLS